MTLLGIWALVIPLSQCYLPIAIKRTHLEQDNASRQQLLTNVELKLCDTDIPEEEICHGIAANEGQSWLG